MESAAKQSMFMTPAFRELVTGFVAGSMLGGAAIILMMHGSSEEAFDEPERDQLGIGAPTEI